MNCFDTEMPILLSSSGGELNPLNILDFVTDGDGWEAFENWLIGVTLGSLQKCETSNSCLARPCDCNVWTFACFQLCDQIEGGNLPDYINTATTMLASGIKSRNLNR